MKKMMGMRTLVILLAALFLSGCGLNDLRPVEPSRTVTINRAENQRLMDEDIHCIGQTIAQFPKPSLASEIVPTANAALISCRETADAMKSFLIRSLGSRLGVRAFDRFEVLRREWALERATAAYSSLGEPAE